MKILGIETSCDETSAAVVENGRQVLSNIVYSQIAKHRPYGGVVPELASRCHVEILPHVIQDALQKSNTTWEQIDAIAVTRGPGLAGALVIGVTAAKSLSLTLQKPLISVNHLEGHLYSIFLGEHAPIPEKTYPVLTLLVSGGHTLLVMAHKLGDYEVLGSTLDDAAGEALDKGANLMKLGYPGGPAIEKLAEGGRADFYRFPRGLEQDKNYSFSFSGLKTALLYYIKNHPTVFEDGTLPHVAASYQEAAFDALVTRLDLALNRQSASAFACVGGVARNKRLRYKLNTLAEKYNVPLLLAAPEYCTDNAAMIAGLAGMKQPSEISKSLEIDPNWRINSRE